ncbi:MAG: flagellar basal body P-ring formation chaperone FlgA [Proteobacteria bacterium]|nr:flagellar basal body P-ring formation chaperone FlgA [Pseudomonadota bacterium]
MKSETLNVKSEKQRRMKIKFILCLLLFTIHYSLFTVSVVFATESSMVELKLKDFIRKFYSEREDIYIKLNPLPSSLQDKHRVKHIDFVRIPDLNGDGLCLVEIDEKNGRTRNLYVSFKVSNKKKMFILKQNTKRGDVVRPDDISVKETYMNGNSGADYPSRMEDVVGKALKRDMPAGTVITCQSLEDSFVIQRGDTVNIVAENKKLLLQAKGRTLERGKIGDIIRVKNLTSDKEIVGRVAGSSTVKVDL